MPATAACSLLADGEHILAARSPRRPLSAAQRIAAVSNMDPAKVPRHTPATNPAGGCPGAPAHPCVASKKHWALRYERLTELQNPEVACLATQGLPTQTGSCRRVLLWSEALNLEAEDNRAGSGAANVVHLILVHLAVACRPFGSCAGLVHFVYRREAPVQERAKHGRPRIRPAAGSATKDLKGQRQGAGKQPPACCAGYAESPLAL